MVGTTPPVCSGESIRRAAWQPEGRRITGSRRAAVHAVSTTDRCWAVEMKEFGVADGGKVADNGNLCAARCTCTCCAAPTRRAGTHGQRGERTGLTPGRQLTALLVQHVALIVRFAWVTGGMGMGDTLTYRRSGCGIHCQPRPPPFS